VELEMWTLKNTATQTLTVGVLPPMYDVPIVFNNFDGDSKAYLAFYKFEPGTTFSHDLFNVPSML
jgi:hypothetical protein